MTIKLIWTCVMTTLFLAAACDDGDNILRKGRTNIAEFGYDTDKRGIWFEVEEAPQVSVVTCTDYARLYAVQSGDDRLLGSIDDLVSRLDGYYLDGEFVPPNITEGCDVLECTPATQDTFFASNVEYKAVGTRAVPEGYADYFPVTWDAELPTELPDVVSAAYEGPALLVFYYYPGNDCSSDPDPLAASLAVFVSDGEVTPR